MRTLVCLTLLAAALAAGAASAQTAQADARVQADAAAASPAQVQAGVQADAKTDVDAAAARKDPYCLTQTGSRVQPRGKQGCVGYGRSYDRKELDRTGETDVGQALRKLDPRLR